MPTPPPIPNVHLTPGDNCGWALDEDRRLLLHALHGLARPAPLAESRLVHSVWWWTLLHLAPERLAGKFIIAQADNPPSEYLRHPAFLHARRLVHLWIARSSQALRQFQDADLPALYAPYTVDTAIFHPPAPGLDRAALRRSLRIPPDTYLLGNFHRDSDGARLDAPKIQKGPDLLLEIATQLHREKFPLHVLLAGPRRHWLRHHLAQRRIPHTFIGRDTGPRDDYRTNILPRPRLAQLYHALDLCLVTSRWEGGPYSLLEAASCHCKILSTPVGLAQDLLEPLSLYTDPLEAVARITADHQKSTLAPSVPTHHLRVHANHTTPAFQRHLAKIYLKHLPHDLLALPARPLGPRLRARLAARALRDSLARHLPAPLARLLRPPAPPLRLLILHQPPPTYPPDLSPIGPFLDAFAEHIRLRHPAITIHRDHLPPGAPPPTAILLARASSAHPLLLQHARPASGPSPTLVHLLDLPSGLAPGERQDEITDLLRISSTFNPAATLIPTFALLAELNALGHHFPNPVTLPIWNPAARPLPTETLPAPQNNNLAGDETSTPPPTLFLFPPDDRTTTSPLCETLAAGIPLIHPAHGHHREYAHFAGIPYTDPATRQHALARLRIHHATYAALARTDPFPATAHRLLHLLQGTIP